uniref:Dynein regulatory complex subunit 2 n=1 Tax=Oryctolagus cuniculus TaxID=9986 RepID=A0A5F9CEJ8_RABIT
MPKRGKKAKIPLSEEEQLLLFQQKLLAEEEIAKKKERLLSQFLKDKLAKEEHNSALNLNKINTQWRAILREVKTRELHRDIEILSQTFERVVDCKDSVIKVGALPEETRVWLPGSLFLFCFAERERERERESLPSTGSVPQMFPKQPGLGQAKARSQKLLPGLPHGHRGPSTWAIFCCFPRCLSRELDWKWRSQDLNLCPHGIRHHRWWLYLLRHSASSVLFLIEWASELINQS